MEKKAVLVVISGPAGTGKGTVVKELVKRGKAEISISATTRNPRGQEQNGVEYHFLTREKFESMIGEDGFLEYAEYCGNYYGSPKAPVDKWIAEGKNVILEIEVEGYQKVKAKRPECIGIFIMPPSMEELESRLRGRNTETEEQIKKRLARAEEEMKLSELYNYVVVNDTVQECADRIEDIFKKETSN